MKIYKNSGYSFTQVSNHLLSNPELSAGAKGLYCYLLSKPDDWDFYIEVMSRDFKDTEYKIKKYLKELEQYKYLYRKRDRNDKGHFGNLIYILYDVPYNELPTVAKSCRRENLPEENLTLYNTNKSNTNKSNTILSYKNKIEKPALFFEENNDIEIIVDNILKKYLFTNKKTNSKNKKTKTYKNICNILENILQNTWVSKNTFDTLWLSKNNINISKINNISILELQSLLEKSIKNYQKLHVEGYWPADKRNLTKSFLDFLYNPRTKKSWFLFCIFVKPIELDVQQSENFMKKFKEKEINAIKPLYKKHLNLNMYWKKMYDIKKWFKQNRKELDKRTPFAVHCSTFTAFIKKYVAFLSDWEKINISNLGANNATWERFEGWLEIEYDVSIKTKSTKLYS